MKLFAVLLLAVCASVLEASTVMSGASVPLRSSATEYEQEVDFAGLPDGVDFDEFDHHQQMFDAIKQGSKQFSVSENRFGKSGASVDASDNSYDTVTTYSIGSGASYYVLDDHVKQVESISDSHFRHCSSGIAGASVGSIVLGSTNADYAKNDVVQSWLDVTNKVSANTRMNPDGLLLARRVTGVRNVVGSECYDVDTENIVHPFLLFDGIEIQSAMRDLEAEVEPEDGDGFEPKMKSMSKCDDGEWSRSWETWQKRYKEEGPSGIVKAAFDSSCAELYKSFPIWSWNRNKDGSATKQNLPLGNDIYCKDCLASLGATIKVVVQFTKKNGKYYLAAKAEMGGNSDMQMDLVWAPNPTFTGKKTGTLVQPSKKFTSFSISKSMTVDLKNQGVTYTSIAHGSAKGTASAGFSLSGSILFATSYLEKKWHRYVTKQLDGKKPWFKSSFEDANFFTYNSMTASESMMLDVSVSVAGFSMNLATVNADVGLQASLAYKYQGKFLPTTRRVNVVKSANAGKTVIEADGSVVTTFASGSPIVDVMSVGQTVTLDAAYEGCYPTEGAIMYFSIVPESGEEIPIAEQHFVTTASGEGSVSTEWTIPSNERFVGSKDVNTRIRARVSHDLEKAADSHPLTLKVFTATDGEVFTPVDGTAVDRTSPMEVTWDATVLRAYESRYDSHFDSADVEVAEVVIDLVGEIVNDDGSVETTYHRVNDGEHFKNDGSASFMIPAQYSAIDNGHRFYIIVSASAHPEVKTWSKGTFTFAPLRDEEGFPVVDHHLELVENAVFSPQTKHLDVIARNHMQLETTSLATGALDFATDTYSLDAPSVGTVELDASPSSDLDIIAEGASDKYVSKWSLGMKLGAFFKDVSVKSKAGNIKPKGKNGATFPIASYYKSGGKKRSLAATDEADMNSYEQRIVASRSQPIVRAELSTAPQSGVPALGAANPAAPLTDAELVLAHGDADMKRRQRTSSSAGKGEQKSDFPKGWMKYTIYTDSDCTNEDDIIMGKAHVVGRCVPEPMINGYVYSKVAEYKGSTWMMSYSFSDEYCKKFLKMSAKKLNEGKCIASGDKRHFFTYTYQPVSCPMEEEKRKEENEKKRGDYEKRKEEYEKRRQEYEKRKQKYEKKREAMKKKYEEEKKKREEERKKRGDQPNGGDNKPDQPDQPVKPVSDFLLEADLQSEGTFLVDEAVSLQKEGADLEMAEPELRSPGRGGDHGKGGEGRGDHGGDHGGNGGNDKPAGGNGGNNTPPAGGNGGNDTPPAGGNGGNSAPSGGNGQHTPDHARPSHGDHQQHDGGNGEHTPDHGRDNTNDHSGRSDERQKIEEMQKRLAPVFDFDGPAYVVYGSSDGCAKSIYERAISFTITKPQACRTQNPRDENERYSKSAKDRDSRKPNGGFGSFKRTCPRDSEMEREQRRRDGKQMPSEDEDFTYDVVTEYKPSNQCQGAPSTPFKRARAMCKAITAEDIMRRYDKPMPTGKCFDVSIYMSQYCGNSLPIPMMREHLMRMRMMERKRDSSDSSDTEDRKDRKDRKEEIEKKREEYEKKYKEKKDEYEKKKEEMKEKEEKEDEREKSEKDREQKEDDREAEEKKKKNKPRPGRKPETEDVPESDGAVEGSTDSTSSTSTVQSSSSDNSAAIAGGVAGAFGALLLAALGYYMYSKRQKPEPAASQQELPSAVTAASTHNPITVDSAA